MNKKTKRAFGAALLCGAVLTLGGLTAEAAETVWVLSGSAVDASGAPQVVTVGQKAPVKPIEKTAPAISGKTDVAAPASS